MAFDYEKIASMLKEQRNRLNISLAELSKMTGIAKTTLQRYETGGIRNIPITKLKVLCGSLRISPDDLIGMEFEEPYQPLPPSHRLPIIGRIACGTPIMAQENTEGYTSVPDSWRADFCLVCRGDSMAPKILDGDVVAIRHQQTADNGQIAVVVIDGEATLKRVYLRAEKGRLELHPINPEYETIVYSEDEIESVRIDGIAVGICRAL
ncbi:MAG: helix-turn-helix domain-containing protein [Oscillospiraceae bacterium]|nr:helix-turn-helix domain-containing protein [Oscillospiraceae bacterium]